MNLLSSFRFRLLLVLAVLLVVTLSVQYYLNLRAQQQSARLRAQQEQALVAGVSLGVKSISSPERLIEMRGRSNQPQFDEATGRVSDIFIIDKDWRVVDSLDPQYLPERAADGTYKYRYIQEVKTLPPLAHANQWTNAKVPLPPSADDAHAEESHMFEVETQEGPWYVIVVLKAEKRKDSVWNAQAARPLVYTLAVMLTAILVTIILVWRFTRPIKDLSEASRRVTRGDLNFRVPAADRSDEMGELSRNINEMIAGLNRKRELEEQLHEAQRSAVVGRLASAIAHEVRNPLNYINLTLDHLRTALAPEASDKRETFNRLVTQLKTEVARINRHVSDLLSYSRPTRLNLQPLDLREAAEDALRMVQAQAEENRIRLEVETEGTSPIIMADREAMRSALTNLALNAVQAMDGRSGQLTITISSEEAGGLVRIEVKDMGPGIPAENVPKLFEPYFSTKETGTGLGLAIVKKAVESHGGQITVESRQGEGTTFTILLPAQRQQQ